MKRGGLNYIVGPLVKRTSQPCSNSISQTATWLSAAKWQEDSMQCLLRNRWWVVVGSFIGRGVDNGVVMAFTFGLFLKPVAAEFGWSRAQVAAALAIAGVTSALWSPIWGKLIDRFGIKPRHIQLRHNAP
jgi:hypothetical protein